MTTIGHFTKQNDEYLGFIETRLWDATASIKPVTKTTDKAPDYRVFANRCEVGAAWTKTSEAGKAYLSITLDDPSFPAPINCRLHESSDGFDLVWTRA